MSLAPIENVDCKMFILTGQFLHFVYIISTIFSRSYFRTVVISILLYGCTTWTLTKRLEKKLNGNYTRMLRAILNKSWRQYPSRHQLYGHLPRITKNIQDRLTRHVGYCWGSRDELISDVLQWTPTYGRTKAGRPARTYIQQLSEDTGCSPEDLPDAMNDRERRSWISVLAPRLDDDDDDDYKEIWFGMIWFYGISTIVGYLMLFPLLYI